MAGTHTRLLYHIVFSTKTREPWLKGVFKNDLFSYMAGIVKNLDGKALIINGAADHVHLLCQLPAKISVAEAVRTIKANSSRWVRQERDLSTFAWQEGYGGFAVSKSVVLPALKDRRNIISNRISSRSFWKYGVEFDENEVLK